MSTASTKVVTGMSTGSPQAAGAWVLWFEGDDPMSEYVEIHGSELEASRAALRDVCPANSIAYSKPVVTFVPYGMSIADAVSATKAAAS